MLKGMSIHNDAATDRQQRLNLITDRDRAILQALVLKVRLFSQRQIAKAWFSGEIANARRRLKALAAAGLLHRMTVHARTLPPIEKPVASWQPGKTPPEFGKTAHRLQERWSGRAVRPVTIYVASTRAAQLCGGRSRGQLKYKTQATHDLGVSAVWLRLQGHAPQWADGWRSEDLLASTRRGEKLPDGFIVNGNEEPVWVIEFGGSYDANRVEEFHEDCASRGLPYQVW